MAARTSVESVSTHATAVQGIAHAASHDLSGLQSGRFERKEVDRESAAHGHAAHAHAEKPTSILTAMASAIINFMLMFGLCSAYGMIMFSDDWHGMHRGLGVKMNLSTAFIMGTLLAGASKVKVAIGGPDLNPTVFIGGFITTIAKELALDVGLVYPAKRRLFDSSDSAYETIWGDGHDRRLGGSSSTAEFCVGAHLAANAFDCADYHEQLRATTIFATTVATGILMILYFGLGRLKLTKFVSYLPTNIMEAFLSCVGFKVFKYALKFCKYEAKQFIPAALVGVPLYFLKATHFGNPAIVMPLGLLIPLAMFYGLVYGSGSDVNQAREANFMFPEIQNVDFWTIWTDSIGKSGQINIKAWMKTLPDLVIMIIVCVLDNLLKLSSTETKLPVKVDKDYEIQVHGLGNILTTLCGSSVGYMQLKFNVINYGVMGNAQDRRAGFMYAAACGVCFFWSIDLANYMPRFFLSALLFFAGAGFVAENLWGSRKYLSFPEWMQVVAILAVFVVMNSLLHAVIVGCLLVGGMFIVKYAKVPCMVGEPQRGGDIVSCERRYATLQRVIQHIASEWLLVIRLKGFLFFASAENLVNHLRGILDIGDKTPEQLESEVEVKPYHRIRFLVLDCRALDDMDSSASKALAKLANECRLNGIKVIWSSITSEFAEDLKTKKALLEDEPWYRDIDEALLHCEDDVLKYRYKMQMKWHAAHPAFELAQDFAKQRQAFQPFDPFLGSIDAHFHCPWAFCHTMKIEAFKTLLWETGSANGVLYLVHSGAIALFEKLPTSDRPSMPVAVYRHGWFLNREALLRTPARFLAICVESGEILFWTRKDWARMERDCPVLANKFNEEVMRQQSSDMDRVSQALRSIDQDPQHSSLDDMLDHFEHSAESTAHHSHLIEQAEAAKPIINNSKSRWDLEVNDKPTTDISGPQVGKKESTTPSKESKGQSQLEGLTAALCLDMFGLYEPLKPDEASVLPLMPEHLLSCLAASWENMVMNRGCDDPDSADARMDVADFTTALMFAGIYNSLIFKPSQTSFTKKEFMNIAHEASMMRMSERQVQTVYDLFEAVDVDHDESLDTDEIYPLMKSVFSKDLTMEDCISYTAAYTKENSVMDKHCFLGLMSRATKKYSEGWLLLRAIKNLWGVRDPRQSDDPFHEINSATIAEQSIKLEVTDATANVAGRLFETIVRDGVPVKESWTQYDLEECLWASHCREDIFEGCDTELLEDCSSIAAAVIVHAEYVKGKLPPMPSFKARQLFRDRCRKNNLSDSTEAIIPGQTIASVASAKRFSTEAQLFAAPPEFIADDTFFFCAAGDAVPASSSDAPPDGLRRRCHHSPITSPFETQTATELQCFDEVELERHRLALERQRLALDEGLEQVKVLQQLAAKAKQLDTEALPRARGNVELEAQHRMMSPEWMIDRPSPLEPEMTGPPEATGPPTVGLQTSFDDCDGIHVGSWSRSEQPQMRMPDIGFLQSITEGFVDLPTPAAKARTVKGSGKPKMKMRKRRVNNEGAERMSCISSMWSDDEDTPSKPLAPQISPLRVEPQKQREPPSSSSSAARPTQPRQPQLDVSPSSPGGLPQDIRPDLPNESATRFAPPSRPVLASPLTRSGSMESSGCFSSGFSSVVRTAKRKGMNNLTRPSAVGKLVLDLRSTPMEADAMAKFLARDLFLSLALEEEKQLESAAQQSDDKQMALAHKQTENLLHDLSRAESVPEIDKRQRSCAERLHALMEDPTSSCLAFFINVIITVAILLSFVLMLLKPIVCAPGGAGKECRAHDNFEYPDIVLCTIFSLEYITRLLSCVGMGREMAIAFIKDITNIFDILAVMPMWISMLFQNTSGAFLQILRITRFLKLARIVRIMKLKNSNAVQKYFPARAQAVIEPCAVVFLVIWAIFMKENLSDA